MLYFRNIINDLRLWRISKARKPLILRGARQVGKSTAIKMFGGEFDTYIQLNLENATEANLFKSKNTINEVINAIFFHKNIQSSPNSTLIFIDEIQNSPEAIAWLRYFYEEKNDIFVIAAGSLLENILDKYNINFPVGRVQYLFLYPLNFEEFLIATKEEQALKILQQIPIPKFAHDKLSALFYRYTLVGGMPEIISSLIYNPNNLYELKTIYQSLLNSYNDDAKKYAKNFSFSNILSYVISSAPLHASDRIIYSKFSADKYKAKDISESFAALEKAMLLKLIYPVTSLNFPAIANTKKHPKLQFLDTGLINYLANLTDNYLNHKELSSVFNGKISEHIVGQELASLDKMVPNNLLFWTRESAQANAEIDFIILWKNKIIPIEVKSGKIGTLKSLHYFIDNCDHDIGVRIYSGQLSIESHKTINNKEFKLLNLPFYLTHKIYTYLEFLIENKA